MNRPTKYLLYCGKDARNVEANLHLEPCIDSHIMSMDMEELVSMGAENVLKKRKIL